MLEADWESAEKSYAAGSLRIQEKELVLWYTACNGVIAKHAAFFSLIAFSALTMTPEWLDTNLVGSQGRAVGRFFFYLFVCISIGFNMLTMVTSWCMIFGPGLAIRGPPGSMKRAVEGMRDEERFTHLFFSAGQGFLTLAAVAMAFAKFPGYVALLVTFVLVFWLSATLTWYFRRPRRSFALEDASGGVDYERQMRMDDPHMHDL